MTSVVNEAMPFYLLFFAENAAGINQKTIEQHLKNADINFVEPEQVARPVADMSCDCLRWRCEGVLSGGLKDSLKDYAAEQVIDFACMPIELFETDYRLAVFDMDSTLIEQEVIDELAKEAGVGEQVAAVTARAMRGELDFNESLRNRVATLKGLQRSAIDQVKSRLTLSLGVEALFRGLNARGIKTAILSGGFTYFAEHVQSLLGIDRIHANQLEIIDDEMTGQVLGEIVNGERKRHYLEALTAEFELSPKQTIAGGDGANDLLMIGAAGLGVAFHAKPLVQAQAPFAINHVGLDALLYMF